MKYASSVAIIVVLLGALTLLSKGIQRNAVPDHEDDPPPKEQPKKAVTQPPPPSSPPRNMHPNEDPIPAVEIFNDPKKAKYHVTIGWVYTPGNQPQSNALQDVLEVARKGMRLIPQSGTGSASLIIVNLDVPPQDRPAIARSVVDMGVDVDGKSIGLDNNPGEEPTTAQHVDFVMKSFAGN